MLALPISPADCLRLVIRPALQLMPEKMDSHPAEVLMLAIALQESGLKTRQQMHGPAHGLWQFEPNGTSAVLGNAATKIAALNLCDRRSCPTNAMDLWLALLTDDILAAGFARLLLWADPHALPIAGDQVGGWATYLRNWRPGKPRPDAWPANYHLAMEACS